MKKTAFILLIPFFLLLSIKSNAQCAKIDSLYRVLRFAKADTHKIDALNLLAYELQILGKKETASFYTKQALKFAQKTDYEKGLADALMQIALLDYNDLGQVGNDIENYQEALKIYEDLKDTTKIAQTLEIIAKFYAKGLIEEKYSKAVPLFERLVNLDVHLHKPEKLAEAYEELGVLYSRLRDDTKAHEYYRKAKSIKDTLGLSSITNERILSKYDRLTQLNETIRESDTYSLTLFFGITCGVLIMIILIILGQRNHAYRLLKQYHPELLEKRTKVAKTY